MPQYHVHGLLLDSAFDIPELDACADAAVLDANPVHIRNSPLPDSIEHHAVSKDGYLIGKDEILIVTASGIRCHIEAGHTVTIDIGNHNDMMPAARFFALSAGLGCLLHQRGLMPLHCAAVKTPAGCVAFCGNAGDGKSTLAASMATRGWTLFTDDRLTVHTTPDHAYVAVPSVPVVHLFENSVPVSGIGDEHLAVNSYRLGKHVHLLPDTYAKTPVPMAGLYFTDWQEPDEEPRITLMSQLEAMMRLRRDISLAHLVELLDQEQQFMHWAADLFASRPAFHLLRPKNIDRHSDCMDLIITHLQDNFSQ